MNPIRHSDCNQPGTPMPQPNKTRLYHSAQICQAKHTACHHSGADVVVESHQPNAEARRALFFLFLAELDHFAGLGDGLDGQAERLKLLHQHTEGGRQRCKVSSTLRPSSPKWRIPANRWMTPSGEHLLQRM